MHILSNEAFGLFLLAIGLLGLLIGGLLNVVIVLLPQTIVNTGKVSSHPTVKLLTAFLSIVVAVQFGFTLQTLAALILTWFLIAITFIDLDHKLIPDDLSLTGLWIGLFLSVFTIFENTTSSILGAILGYLVLWSVYWIFKWITQKEGMGYGDFKLLAMLGAWLGWQALPLIILLSSFLGTMIGITWILLKKKNKSFEIPFGPFLALGGFAALLWGNRINQWYLTLMGL